LDFEYDRINENTLGLLKVAGQCTLSIDGSDDQCNDGVTNIIALCPKQYLLGIVRFEGETQSSDKIMIELDKYKQELDEMKVEINGLITDNENKMKSMRAKFVEKYGESMAIQ